MAMFLLQCKKAVAVMVAIAVILATASAGLAQQPSDRRNPASQGAASPVLKFEIRSWRNGEETGKPITVEMAAGSSYTVETPDAVIHIRPRDRLDRASQTAARVRELETLLRRGEEKIQTQGNELFKFQTEDLIRKALRQDEQKRQEARKTLGEPAMRNADGSSRSAAENDIGRRLEKLERQLDEVIQALRAPKAESK